MRIELTTLRVLPWTEKAARPKKLLHRKLGHSTVRLPVENRMCFMKVYNVSLQGRNVGRVIGQRSRRFGVFTRKIKSHVWIRKFQVSFFYERQHYLGCEMSKLKLQKIVGNLLDKFRKLYMNGTEQSSRNLYPSSSNRKLVVGCPWKHTKNFQQPSKYLLNYFIRYFPEVADVLDSQPFC